MIAYLNNAATSWPKPKPSIRLWIASCARLAQPLGTAGIGVFDDVFEILTLAIVVGLTAKFSTSVISENLLYSTGLIALPLYSTIMGAFIVLKPIIVGVFASTLATTKDTIQ